MFAGKFFHADPADLFRLFLLKTQNKKIHKLCVRKNLASWRLLCLRRNFSRRFGRFIRIVFIRVKNKNICKICRICVNKKLCVLCEKFPHADLFKLLSLKTQNKKSAKSASEKKLYIPLNLTPVLILKISDKRNLFLLILTAHFYLTIN